LVEEYDILIKGGVIVDGTGAPYFVGDVGVRGGRIVRVGRDLRGSALSTIDACGLVVAPGFIDIHNHSDFTVLAVPTADSIVAQGVTTAVVGNCGMSMAPVNPANLELLRRYLEPFLVPGFDYGWDWRTLGEFYGKVEERGVSINLVPLVGHGTVRIAVKGFDPGKPTRDELDEMKELLRQAVRDGAWGLSSGLIYPPGSYATTEELVELAKVLREFPVRLVYSSHIRNEGDRLMEAVEEAITVGEEAGVPVEISHHKATGKRNWGKVSATLREMERARRRGVEVNCDVYPYIAGSTTIMSLLPGWVLEGGVERALERLRDVEVRRRVREEIEEDRFRGGENWIKMCGWEGIYIASCPQAPEYEGRSLKDVLSRWGDPYEGLFNFLLSIGGKASMVVFYGDEEDMETVLRSPLSCVGSDSWATAPHIGGKPHPRTYGTFPRVLGRYVRERRILSLEEAVRKMTSQPAGKLGLQDRGLIREGFWADIVVFDPNTITDRATYQDPHQYPQGIHYVIVNGQVVIERGKHVGKLPGKILKNPLHRQ
jgi:N-acyl-D-amino-acid deacylase